MATIVKPIDNKELILMVKGSYEKIISMCSDYYHQQKLVPLD